ncbi:hypothetical protein MNB_SUP05-SYMBIONT-5-1222 [hydrothermal vent metagenome]|uniref:Uncharacterized protein n=1 Tax=hydrothermal vent metagenome TaxID=652676 RepID=A0A1W1E3K7_9ZZZZ
MEDEANFEELFEYFSKINYLLEQGDEYFYFSKPKEKNIDLERKIERAFEWIDIIDFFKTYDSSFDVGFRFTPSEVVGQLQNNADLKAKLENLKKVGSEKKKYLDRIKRIIEKLEKDNYVALENELSETYKVLNSFNYLKDLVNTINIPEDIKNEIPK